MNFFERVLVFLGLAEEAEEEEILEEEEHINPAVHSAPAQDKVTKRKEKKGAAQRKQVKNEQKSESVVPLRSNDNYSFKVHLLAPKKYEEAQVIGKYLKSGYPVIVNLEQLEMETAKQMIDFVSGTVFALDGNLNKVGQQIFLFSPPNVGIEGEIDSSGEEIFGQTSFEE